VNFMYFKGSAMPNYSSRLMVIKIGDIVMCRACLAKAGAWASKCWG